LSGPGTAAAHSVYCAVQDLTAAAVILVSGIPTKKPAALTAFFRIRGLLDIVQRLSHLGLATAEKFRVSTSFFGLSTTGGK
jgi:hypothetical protein